MNSAWLSRIRDILISDYQCSDGLINRIIGALAEEPSRTHQIVYDRLKNKSQEQITSKLHTYHKDISRTLINLKKVKEILSENANFDLDIIGGYGRTIEEPLPSGFHYLGNDEASRVGIYVKKYTWRRAIKRWVGYDWLSDIDYIVRVLKDMGFRFDTIADIRKTIECEPPQYQLAFRMWLGGKREREVCKATGLPVTEYKNWIHDRIEHIGYFDCQGTTMRPKRDYRLFRAIRNNHSALDGENHSDESGLLRSRLENWVYPN